MLLALGLGHAQAGLAAPLEKALKLEQGNNTDTIYSSPHIRKQTTPTAASLSFTTQPGGGSAGTAWSVQPVVKLLDANGNVVATGSDSTVTITLSISQGNGTLAGTVSKAAVAGVANFTNLSITTANGNLILLASASATIGALAADSNSFSVTATTAKSLVFQSQPNNTFAGNVITGIAVNVVDKYNNVVTSGSDATTTVTLSMVTSNGNLTGAVSGAAAAGLASFANVTINQSGSKTITAKATLSSAGAVQVSSSSFTISPAIAKQLLFTTQPGGGKAGTSWSAQPVVAVVDAFNNTVTTGSDAVATISLYANGGNTTLSGTSSLSASSGVATFSGLSVTASAANNTLTANAILQSGAVSLKSSNFSVNSASASQLVFTVQPAGGTAGAVWNANNVPVVTVQDAYGNTVNKGTDSVATITLSLTQGNGTVAGTYASEASLGVANFSPKINTSGNDKKLTARASLSSGSSVSVQSQVFTISPAAANQLVFAVQPNGGIAGTAWTQQPLVQVEDFYGNVVTTGNDSTANVTLILTTGNGTLSGNYIVVPTAGVANFTNLSINTVGKPKILSANATLSIGPVTVKSKSFAITAAQASNLTFITQPGGGRAGVAWSTQPVVAIQDAYGNNVTTGSDSTASVVLTLSQGGGNLSGTATVQGVVGAASFSALSINVVGNNKLLTATATLAGSSVSVNSNLFSITPASASSLLFASQPNDALAGNILSPNVLVVVVDRFNNIVTTGADANSQIKITLIGNGTLSGTANVLAVLGNAIFTSLSINQSGVKSLKAKATFSAGNAGVATSGDFNISSAIASKLLFSQQPGGGAAGNVLISQPVVTIVDSHNNIVTTGPDSNVTVYLSQSGGNGTLSGNLSVVANAGVATFANLTLNLTGNNKVLLANATIQTGLVTTNSNVFTILPAVANQLIFSTQPGGGVAGTAWSQQPVVTVADVYGNTITTGSDRSLPIFLSITQGGGNLSGTYALSTTKGVATFTNVFTKQSGNTRKITATTNASVGNLSVQSSSFDVSPAPASKLVFSTQPNGATAGSIWTTQPVVEIQDIYSNIINVGADANDQVVLSLAKGTGNLSGNTTVSAVVGVVNFNNLTINTTGKKSLLANATLNGNFVTAVSSVFTVSGGLATQLVFSTQPTNGNETAGTKWSQQPVVQVQDGNGNVVTTGNDSSVLVTLTLSTGTGVLSGNVSLNANAGVAAFKGLSVNLSGNNKQLTAAASLQSGSVTVNSNTFTLSSSAAKALVFNIEPNNTTAGSTISPNIVVYIVDNQNNIVNNSADGNVTVTLSIVGIANAITGTTAVSAVNGVATFAGLNIKDANSYVIQAKAILASSPKTIKTNSSVFTINAAAASQISYLTQPGGGLAGVLWSNQPEIAVTDSYGNIVTSGNDSNVLVALALSAGNGTIANNSNLLTVAGIASFSGLSISTSGNNFVLAANTRIAAGNVTVNSNVFTIGNGGATQLIFTSQPGGGLAGTAWSTQPVVKIADSYGNAIASGSDSKAVVKLSITSGSGNLIGTRSLAATAGVANFTGLSMNVAGNVKITASANLAASALSQQSNVFVISPATAANLVFTTQPDDAISGNVWLTQPVVSITDVYGNVVGTGVNSNVSVTLTVYQGNAVLSGGNTSVNANLGVATFAALNSNVVGSSVKLQAAATLSSGSATVLSNVFSVNQATASQLIFTTQPNGAVAGGQWTTQPVLKIWDNFNNLITSGSDSTAAVQLVIIQGNGSLVGTTQVRANGGVVSFSGLSITTSGNVMLQANAVVGGTAVNSNSSLLVVAPGAASQLIFSTQPNNTVAGNVISPNIVVYIADASGNLVSTGSDATAAVSLTLTKGTGTLSGNVTSVAAVAGVATFNSASINLSGNGKVITASATLSSAGAVNVASQSIYIAPAVANGLIFSLQPGAGSAGSSLSVQPMVNVVDAYGNTVTTGNDSNVLVTVGINSGNGTLAGNYTKWTASGVATFTNLNINLIGNKTLIANAIIAAGNVTVNSNLFVITSGQANQLVFTAQPGGGSAGTAWSTQPIVSIEDIYGNPISSGADSHLLIALTISQGNGSLVGIANVQASSGMANFTGLNMSVSGNKKLTASTTTSAGTAISLQSNLLVVAPSTATKIAFATQPNGGVAGNVWSGQPVVQILDAYGNLVSTGADSSATVNTFLSYGTGSLTGNVSVAANQGIATFSGLSLNLIGSNKALTANAALSSGNTKVLSNIFSITAAQANQLVYITQPSGGSAGSVWTAQPAVQILDVYGNLVSSGSDSSVPVYLTLSAGTGNLSGTASATASGGIASFTGLSLSSIGNNKVLTANTYLTVGNVSIASNTFSITGGSAVALLFTTQPNAVIAGNVISPNIVVAIVDQYNNTITTGADSSRAITLTLASGTGALTGNLVLNANAGVASFGNIHINLVGNKTLRATAFISTGTVSVNSNSFAVAVGAANQLVFTTLPGGGSAGAVWSTQPVVSVTDAYGNIVSTGNDSNVLVAMVLTTGNGTLAGGNYTLNTNAGVATFGNFSISLVGTKALTANTVLAAGAVSVVSSNFTILAGSANQLLFATQPGGGVAGNVWSTQPIVTIADKYGNPIISGTDSTATVSVSLTQGNGSLLGTTNATASSGVATFSSLRMTNAQNAKRITASAALSIGTTTVQSSNFNITFAPAALLSFSTQPNGAVAGNSLSVQPNVLITDTYGNLVSSGVDSNLSVVLTLVSGTGSLAGNTTINANGGIAMFSGVNVNLTGYKNLKAAATASVAGAISTVSQAFSITPANANALVFYTQPVGATAGSSFAAQPVVQLQDAYGNIVTSGSDSNINVILSLSSGTGNITGTLTQAASAGVATFSGLSMTVTGNNKVITALSIAQVGNLTQTSNTFTIIPAPARYLSFATQPNNAVAGATITPNIVVNITDQYNNIVTTGTDSTKAVALSIGTGTGTISGTSSVAAVAGVSTFAGLSINLSGNNKVLKASAALTTGNASQNSNTFTILTAQANQLVFSVEPNGGTAGSIWTTQPVVQVKDAYGNVVTTGNDSNVVIYMALTGGNGTLSGNTAILTTQGVATFSGLKINLVGNYTKILTANTTLAVGEASVASSNFSIVAAAGNMLIFSTLPGSSTAGLNLSTQPVVNVTDAYGNIITSGSDSTASITLTISQGNGTVTGNSVLSANQGIATFSGLKVNTSGNAKRITATATLSTPGSVTVQSANFDIATATASQLVYTTQPGGGTAGTAWSTQPVVAIQDAYGNVVSTGSDSTATVTATILSGSGSLSGNSVVTAANGIATFSGLSISVAGSVVLKSAATLNSVAVNVSSSSFTISPGPGYYISSPLLADKQVLGHSDVVSDSSASTMQGYGVNSWQLTSQQEESLMASHGAATQNQLPEEATVSLWFKASAVGSGSLLASFDNAQKGKDDDNNHLAALYLDEAGHLNFMIQDGLGVQYSLLDDEDSFDDKAWHHVSVGYCLKKKTLMLVVDGQIKIIDEGKWSSLPRQKGQWKLDHASENIKLWSAQIIKHFIDIQANQVDDTKDLKNKTSAWKASLDTSVVH